MRPFKPAQNYVLTAGTSPATYPSGFYVIQQLHFATNNAANWQDATSPKDLAHVYAGTLFLPRALQYVNSPVANPNIVPEQNLPGPRAALSVPQTDSTFFNGFVLQPGTYGLTATFDWWTTSPAPTATPLRLVVVATVYNGGTTGSLAQILTSQATVPTTETALVEYVSPSSVWYTDTRVTATLSATFIVADSAAVAPNRALLWFQPAIVGSPSLNAAGLPNISVGFRNLQLRQVGSNAPGLDATPA
jgi:hypothetical protein